MLYVESLLSSSPAKCFWVEACLATAKILQQFKNQVLTPPMYVQATPLLPRDWPSAPDSASASKGWGDDGPIPSRGLVSVGLCSPRGIRLLILPGMHTSEQPSCWRHGGPDPRWGRVCLLGAGSAVPLCRRNRPLVSSPAALQTQLCCGRFNTYLMRTMCMHTYGCVYICLHIHTT